MFLMGLWNYWIEMDYAEAVKWYHKAAEQGHANAQFSLGVCFMNGQGVAKDPVEAMKWYRKAIEHGHPDAQFSLGGCFKIGQGVAEDPVEAVKWYRKAAEQGHAKAQFNLGWCLMNGQGVAMDPVEAVKWYRKASDHELVIAQFNLGWCFMNGEGVAKDLEEAAKWFQKAADQGSTGARQRLDEVIRQIPEWRDKSSALTEQFHATLSVSSRSHLLVFTHGVPITPTPTPLTTTNACSNRGNGARRSFRCVGARTPASQSTGRHLRALMAGH
jgi:TPR repeat protein